MNKIYMAMLCALLFSCGQEQRKFESRSGNNGKVKVRIFQDIQKTRDKLSSVGIGNLGNWRDDEMGGFISLTPYYTFGHDNLNNLAYYLESNNPNYVKDLKLVLNINNKSEKKIAIAKLAEVTKKTFEVLALDLPKNLISSIKDEKQITIEGAEFITALELQKSKIETWILTIKSKELLAK